MNSSCLAPRSEAELTLEFEPHDIARCVDLWRASAGRTPALALHVEGETGVVAMFAPVASWDELGTARDFDLVYPLRHAPTVALALVAPWHALPISDFLSHVYDASRTATPDEVIRTVVRCIDALETRPSRRLRATAFAPAAAR